MIWRWRMLKHGAGFVFYALMDAVVDRCFPIIEDMASGLEGIELQIFVRGSARSNIEQLYALKQRIRDAAAGVRGQTLERPGAGRVRR